jgi:hypothetical protein
MHSYEFAPADLYPMYEAAREETELALADWRAAPSDSKREVFAVYRAAAEREDAAALAWLLSCEAYDDAHAAELEATMSAR